MTSETSGGLSEVEIEAELNGVTVRRRVKARQHLADFLREEMNVTSTHLGCEHGVCGACTVLMDGVAVRGCLTLAAQADGCRIETVEGLNDRPEFAALQDAFIERNAAQCSFCTSGMLLTAYELVRSEHIPSREEIRDHISGNMCRCTGYQAIVEAISTCIEKRSGT